MNPLLALLDAERPPTAGPVLPGQPPRLGHPYGLQALLRECEQLAGLAPDSRRRNHTLYLAGLRLHSLVAGGVLDDAEVTAQLLAAAQRCELDQREAARTIASARQTAIKHPRGVPDRPVASRRATTSPQRGQGRAGRESAPGRVIVNADPSTPRGRSGDAW